MANSLLSLFSQIYDGIPEASMNWSGYLPQKSMLYVYRQILLKVLLIVGPVFAIAFLLAFWVMWCRSSGRSPRNRCSPSLIN